MRFVDDLRRSTGGLWDEIHTMPFNEELMLGTLPADTFRGYIIQDAHYLAGFARALALTAARAPKPQIIGQLAGSANTAASVETMLHGTYMAEFGVSESDFNQTPRSQACDHYVSHLISIAASEPFEVSVAALLPCFWLYNSVGRKLNQGAVPGNRYQLWIDTYSGEKFEQSANRMLDLTDHVAEAAPQSIRTGMARAFGLSVRHEWMFWKSAYERRSWEQPSNDTRPA